MGSTGSLTPELKGAEVYCVYKCDFFFLVNNQPQF